MVIGEKIVTDFEHKECEEYGIYEHYEQKRDIWHEYAIDCYVGQLRRRLARQTLSKVKGHAFARFIGQVLGRSVSHLDTDFNRLLKHHGVRGTEREEHLRELMGFVAVQNGEL